MSLENAKRFIAIVSQDRALQQKLAAAREPTEAIRLAVQAGSERGLTFTAEEFLSNVGSLPGSGSGEELSDDQLGAVAGGLGFSPSQAAVRNVANRTPERESAFLTWLNSLTPDPS